MEAAWADPALNARESNISTTAISRAGKSVNAIGLRRVWRENIVFFLHKLNNAPTCQYTGVSYHTQTRYSIAITFNKCIELEAIANCYTKYNIMLWLLSSDGFLRAYAHKDEKGRPYKSLYGVEYTNTDRHRCLASTRCQCDRLRSGGPGRCRAGGRNRNSLIPPACYGGI